MRWLLLGHGTPINSDPRPANHDLLTTTCVFPWRQSSNMNKDWLLSSMSQYVWKLNYRWQNHSNWYSFHWVTLDFIQKLILFCLTHYLEQCWKCTKIQIIMSYSKFFQCKDIYIFQIYMFTMYVQCLFVVIPFESLLFCGIFLPSVSI